MRKFYFIFCILITITKVHYCQNITIYGTIENIHNKDFIPFVNIGLKETYLGTTTNLNGEFEIKLPSNKKYRTLVISCIGYENKEVEVSENQTQLNISLTPLMYDISEVTIMPDSTLRSFLLKAYRKIPENYPNFPSRYEGFYRASIQKENQEYIRFMEVLTEFYKTSYKNKESGTVKVIESRKFVSEKEYNDLPVVYYGGIHYCHRADMVKFRSEYLKASKKYNYKLVGNTMFNNKEVYIIDFYPAKPNSDCYKGTLYIESESLAYVKIEEAYTEKQLKKRSQIPAILLKGITSTTKSLVTNYSNYNGKYYLKSIYETETLKTRDGKLFYAPVEYVVTCVARDSVEKIPYNEISPITYTPAIEAQDYHESNWKDYGTLPLNNKINLDSLQNDNTFKTKKLTIHQLIPIIQKLNIEMGIGIHPVSVKHGNYSLKYQHLQFDKKLNDINHQLSFYGNIGYNFSSRHQLEYGGQQNLSKNDFVKIYHLKYKHTVPIKTMGRQISAHFNAGWEWQKNGVSLGTQTSDTDFKFGDKKFNNHKVQAYTGTKTHGLSLGGGLNIQISNLLHLSFSASYFSPVKTEEVIILQERSGFILSRKKANQPISNSDIFYSIDGLESTDSGFKKENWNTFFGLSMKF
ncbi:carboxypeptidase-like regulatory domain-containing protein [Labilibacter sediminis]|nr:carboxypeptidase-like regulatory domain-containing protein [Labilibacter sediminis]